MSEKRLKFNNIRVNKKEFHKSEQPMDLDLLTVNQIVVSDKFKHSDESSMSNYWGWAKISKWSTQYFSIY